MSVSNRPLFDPPIVKRAVRDAVAKLHPRTMVRNPVMFVVFVGSTTWIAMVAAAATTPASRRTPSLMTRLFCWTPPIKDFSIAS